MKKLKVLLIVFIVLIALGIAALVLLYFMHKNTPGFLRGTTLNGEDISGMTAEQVLDKTEKKYSDFSVVITEDGETALEGNIEKFGFTFDRDAFLKTLSDADKAEKANPFSLYKTLLVGNALNVDAAYTFDEETFRSFVCGANLKEPRYASTPAMLVLNDDGTEYQIQNARQGNEVDDAKLQEDVLNKIRETLENGGDSLTMEIPDDVYTSQPIENDTAPLEAELEQKNKELKLQNTFGNMTVTYTFGNETQVLDSATIISWISYDENGNFVVDDNAIASYVSDLAATYDTRSKTRTFKTSGGQTIEFTGGENQYGYIVNQEGECAQLKSDILAAQPVSREPVYYKTNSYGNPWFLKREGTDDLAGTYVEVSIGQQHVWFYKDGQLVIDSPCVTGTPDGHDTATGVYPLAYKESPSVLRGGDAANGYETEVQYWMPFHDGQGLHDASWRSSFGGTIYKTNGSHGCVNLPPDVAKTIFENIDTGTAIVLYN